MWAKVMALGLLMLSGVVGGAKAQTTISGTHLSTWTVSTQFFFDATNEFSANSIGHTVTITAGTGLTAGNYQVNSAQLFALGGQGTHWIVTLFPMGMGSAYNPGVVTGGSWHFQQGTISPGVNSTGTCLTQWNADSPDGSWYFDPDAPINPNVLGRYLVISGGTGMTAGTYYVMNVWPLAATGAQGTQTLIKLSPVLSVLPGASPEDTAVHSGATWTDTSGTRVPLFTANTGFVGPIDVCIAGDSIPGYLEGNQVGGASLSARDALLQMFPNASHINVISASASGSTTTTWLPTAAGSPNNINFTVAAANTAGSTVMIIELGTNDAATSGNLSAMVHCANMQVIVNYLFANIPTLRRVVLPEHGYVFYGLSPGDNTTTPPNGASVNWTATSDTLLQGYWTGYASISGAVQGPMGLFAYSQTVANHYLDGVHPNGAGIVDLEYYWFNAAAPSIIAAGSPTIFRRGFGFSHGLRHIH